MFAMLIALSVLYVRPSDKLKTLRLIDKKNKKKVYCAGALIASAIASTFLGGLNVCDFAL
jgi:hypothetical protein